MKIFEIIDAELELSMGVLLYYEKEKTCIIKKNIRLFGFTCASLRILRNHGYRSNAL